MSNSPINGPGIGHDDTEPSLLSGRRDSRDAIYDDDPRDPEITLGTMTVLGIFFGLAVLCAGFFGFGYSVGLRRAASANVSIAAPAPAASSNSIPKPAPGSITVPADTSLTDAITAPVPAVETATPAKSSAARVIVAANGAPDTNSTPHPTPPSSSQEPTRAIARTIPPAGVAAAAPLPAIQGPSSQTMVQVAALTRPEDAQIVVSALKSKGYDATVHTSPQDRFLHVQVGPFTSRKDAETMRQRILADGFNAMLK